MKTIPEVQKMLAEAKAKYAKASDDIRLGNLVDPTHAHLSWGEMETKKQLAEREIQCFTAVLGADALGVAADALEDAQP